MFGVYGYRLRRNAQDYRYAPGSARLPSAGSYHLEAYVLPCGGGDTLRGPVDRHLQIVRPAPLERLPAGPEGKRGNMDNISL